MKRDEVMWKSRSRAFLAIAGLLCLLSSESPGGQVDGAGQPGKPLNVIMILADDLGWSDLGCYGSDLHETPNLDRLAQQGVRFTQAYAASVCSPTRAAILTGKHHARLHMTTWREASANPPRNRRLIPPLTVGNLPHEEMTLAEVLQSKGYLTALVGKWHLGDAPFYPETQGFDVNIGGTLWGAPNTYFFPYRGARRPGGEFRYVPHLEGGRPGEYLTDRLTEEALRIVDSAGDRPFFLFLAHHAVHTPVEAKTDLVAHYTRKIRPGLRHRNPRYAAMVQSLDESVGRILNRLDERGLSERTVVIFASDNGGYVNEYDGLSVTSNAPLRSGKGSLYEGGIRVPLIIRWPGNTTPGGICHELVESQDYFPTVLEMTGVTFDRPAASELEGRSLVGLLKRPSGTIQRESLYFHYPHYYPTTTPVSAVRSGRWKFLEFHEDGKGELYDLDRDLGESRDLASQRPEVAHELRQLLHRWLDRVKAQMPTVNPAYRTGG